jgi:hypothetical protein
LNSDKRTVRYRESGNVAIYVIIALALLGLLTATLSNQGDRGGDQLDSDRAALLTSDLISYTSSVKNVIDQMTMSGTALANLNFIRPNMSSFDLGSNINKVYHPDGGGLTLPVKDDNLFTDTGTTPPAGWYLGMFNNVDWTPTTANDVVLAAHGISQEICGRINKKITGSTTIPTLAGGGNSAKYFVDDDVSAVANADLTVAACAACEGLPSLCVANTAGTLWTYYSIISAQ